MELKELTEKTLEILEVESVSEISDKLMKIALENETEYHDKFILMFTDLGIDYFQKIFQYNEADRKEKKQDYTPACLGKLVSVLVDNSNTVIDMCAGTGSLTIQKWSQNKSTKFICIEFDERVIPYLMFNLSIRNMNSTIKHQDILSKEVFNEYQIIPGKKYGRVVKKP